MYLSAFVIDRGVLFWAICNLYLAGRVWEFRRIVGHVSAGEMVALYCLSLLC